jgi:putative hydrolase of the HAD superfamily
MTSHRYEKFKSYFDKFYLSHNIGLRKPNKDIFEFVLNENKLEAKNCYYIDDTKEHIDSANQLGFQTWNLNPAAEDVVDMFKINSEKFL